MHHGTVLKTVLLLLSVVTGLHRILGQNSFFFFTGRYRFFYRPLRGCAGFQVRILFFFVTDTIASVIGYYGVAEDSGSKSFFFKKKWSHSPIRQDTNSVSRVLQAANTSVLSVLDQNNKRDE